MSDSVEPARLESSRVEPSEEELILHCYGEGADPTSLAARIAASPDAARRHAELLRLFAAIDGAEDSPAPAGLEEELWQRLRPQLDRARPLARVYRLADRGRRWLPAAAAAVLLLAIGYLAGRMAPEVAPPRAPAAVLSAEARQRLLAETLAEHLERSQRLFTELANLPPDDGGDLAAERQAARELLAESRLYRTAAQRGNREGVAALLAQMEPVLLDLANLPAEPSAADVEFLRRRIEAQGLLFKTRVASGLLERFLQPVPPPPSPPRPSV